MSMFQDVGLGSSSLLLSGARSYLPASSVICLELRAYALHHGLSMRITDVHGINDMAPGGPVFSFLFGEATQHKDLYRPD